MALISQIRKNSWLLVVLIALGLIGFIVQDMTSGQQSLFGSSQFTMGEIEDKKLDWNQFNRVESILYGNSGGDIYLRREALWNYFVEEAIVAKEADALGLGVSKTELLDLQFGPNPSPVIQQRFIDPTTQMLNRQRLNEFKTAIEGGQFTDPNLRAYWAHQEKEVIKDRLQSKLSAIVSQAMYTPSWMAEMGYQESNQRVDFAVVKVPYDEVDNTEVSLSDADFEAYLKENRAVFERKEETRVLEYVVFNVQPTPEDSAKWRQQIVDLIPGFQAATDDSAFVELNLGSYDPAYVKKEALSPVIADSVFNLPAGTVYGPYIDGTFYRAVKVIDKKVIPDSVRSRHILIGASDPLTLGNAQKTIDSLKTLIESGQESFDSLALKFGMDASRTKGGDLGYAGVGGMVKPYNDLIFYQAEEGKLYTVITQFGAHLVEVTGRKFINNSAGVKVAYLQQSIDPSEETQNAQYDQAFSFIGKNEELDQLRKSIGENKGLSLETAPPVAQNEFTVGNLGTGQASRDMIRWAFETGTKGDVSREVYTYQDPQGLYNNKYVVVGLRDVLPAGLPTVESIRAEIEPLVINKKKAEVIAERIKGKDMGAIASQFSTQIDTLRGVPFDQPMVDGLGAEPKVIGTVFSLDVNKVSEAIQGNTGVYVVKLLNKPAPPAVAGNLSSTRISMSMAARSQVPFRLLEAMRQNADIEDNRFRFY